MGGGWFFIPARRGDLCISGGGRRGGGLHHGGISVFKSLFSIPLSVPKRGVSRVPLPNPSRCWKVSRLPPGAPHGALRSVWAPTPPVILESGLPAAGRGFPCASCPPAHAPRDAHPPPAQPLLPAPPSLPRGSLGAEPSPRIQRGTREEERVGLEASRGCKLGAVRLGLALGRGSRRSRF